jgi:hypothetical protein
MAVLPLAPQALDQHALLGRLARKQAVDPHRRQKRVGADQIVGLACGQKKPIGSPSASTRAWILVLSPPRERPIAWSGRRTAARSGGRPNSPLTALAR